MGGGGGKKLRRAVRRWRLGLPQPPSLVVAGRPAGLWLWLYGLAQPPGGVMGRDWPDGRPLLAQSWPQVAVFRVIADELAQIQRQEAAQRKD